MHSKDASPSRGAIGVIGGLGKLGRWFSTFLQDHPLFEGGQEFFISDIGTDLSPTEVAERSDVVIVSVPITVVPTILQEILPLLTSDKLLIEVTSVKSHISDLLTTASAEVLSLHPMFAPSVVTPEGQRVTHWTRSSGVARTHTLSRRFLQLLEGAGAILVPISPLEHDKAMAVIQGLSHLSAIALGYALKKLDADVSALEALSSPVYRIRMDMVARVLAHDPRLYGEISVVNPYVSESIKAFEDALQELTQCVEGKDLTKFSEIFSSAAAHLGDFRIRAQEESEYLISLLAQRDKLEK